MKFCDNLWDPSYFPMPNCLCHVSFSRYSPLSLEVVEKPNKCKSFWPPFFREGRPQLFCDRLLARPTVNHLAKCGWVPFADLRLRSEVECRFYGGWVKNHLQFEAVCGSKLTSLWDDVADPSWLLTHLLDCLYHVLFGGYSPLNLTLSCEVVQKVVLGPNL